MTENGSDAPAAPVAPGQEPADQPSLSIITQYVKDLSFENPNAPKSLNPENGTPEIELGVNVQARAGDNELYDVEIRISAKATHGEETAFVAELVYGGLFQLKNFPPEALEMMCMIECPRLLFPFARRVIADATRDGGFSPLMLDPIDFKTLFQNHKAQAMAGQQPMGTA
jgi:preprotein translocase subunit SecB